MVCADELDVDKDFGWPVREMKKRDGTPKIHQSFTRVCIRGHRAGHYTTGRMTS